MKQAQFYYQDAGAPTPNRPIHLGTTILLRCRGRFLLEKRSDSNTWAFIGGGLEMNETFPEGMVRELFEETGIRLSAQQLRFYKIYDDPSRIAEYPDGNILRIVTVVYRASLPKVPPLFCSDESRALHFFTKSEIARLPLARTHLPIASDLLRRRAP